MIIVQILENDSFVLFDLKFESRSPVFVSDEKQDIVCSLFIVNETISENFSDINIDLICILEAHYEGISAVFETLHLVKYT